MRESALDIHKKAVDALPEFDGKILVIHPAEVRIKESEYEDRFVRAKDSIMNLLDYADSAGVVVALENLFGTKKRFFWSLVKEMEMTNIAYCFDTGHALVEGGDPIAKFRRLSSRVVTVHLQDNQGSYDNHLMPFDGIFPWQLFMRVLYNSGYGGNLLLECNPQSHEQDLVAWLKRAYGSGKRLRGTLLTDYLYLEH